MVTLARDSLSLSIHTRFLFGARNKDGTVRGIGWTKFWKEEEREKSRMTKRDEGGRKGVNEGDE